MYIIKVWGNIWCVWKYMKDYNIVNNAIESWKKCSRNIFGFVIHWNKEFDVGNIDVLIFENI